MVCLFLSLFAYPIAVFRNNNHNAVEYLLERKDISELEAPAKDIPEGLFLLLLLVVKVVGTVLSVGFVDVPCGVYTPIFVIGAILGRIVGELAAYGGRTLARTLLARLIFFFFFF